MCFAVKIDTSAKMQIEKILIICAHYILRGLYLITLPIFTFFFETKSAQARLPTPASELLMLSGVELGQMVRKREVTSEQLVTVFYEYMKMVNPIVNAVIADRYEEALSEARHVDRMLDKEGGSLPEEWSEDNAPFLGVPFTSKEAFAIKGLPHSSGLWSRANLLAESDADVIVLLKKSGAIPLALTNVSELCMWYESSNLVYGRSNNAYHRGRIVGGSSGGEACLVSTGASVIGVGSDIGGSIRMPAFFNGIYGHKPTVGIVSNNGQFPNAQNEAQTFLSTGPLVRHACDLLPMLKIMAGPDGVAKLKLDQKVNVKNLKFYYMEDDGGSYLLSPCDHQIKAAIQKAATHFASLGAIVRKAEISKLKYSFNIWASKMNASGNEAFCSLMGDSRKPVRPLVEFFLWLVRYPRHTLPAIGLGLGEKVKESPELTKRFRQWCEDLIQEFQDMLGDDGVFLYPCHPKPAPYHNQPLLMFPNFAYTGIFNVLGLPVTAVPMGLASEGVPIGIQVVGSKMSDHLTLAVAQEMENVFGGWVHPF